jgi:hypothetical protein
MVSLKRSTPKIRDPNDSARITRCLGATILLSKFRNGWSFPPSQRSPFFDELVRGVFGPWISYNSFSLLSEYGSRRQKFRAMLDAGLKLKVSDKARLLPLLADVILRYKPTRCYPYEVNARHADPSRAAASKRGPSFKAYYAEGAFPRWRTANVFQ